MVQKMMENNRVFTNEKRNGENAKRSVAGILWNSMVIALSMYSRIPVPFVEWKEEGMKYALCFFPLVGVVLGGLMTGFCLLAEKISLGIMAFACIGAVLPLMITGGIHMDGFLDVADARSSCQTRERKLEILKDPHTGAFAIIRCGVYLLLYVAVFGELRTEVFPGAGGIFVLERALSGWSVVAFPKAKSEGLVSTFSGGAQKKIVKIVMAGWGVGAVLFLMWTQGMVAGGMIVVAALAVFRWYYRMSIQEFGGITGDLAGYFLQLCELVMFGVLAIFR